MAGRGPSPASLAAQRVAKEAARRPAVRAPAKAPKGVGASGRALWRAVLAAVADDWELDEKDLALLERAARLSDMETDLEAAVKKHGVMTQGSTGQLVVSPAVAELRQTRAQIARLLAQIELAPPKATTRHLNGRQRNALRDLRVIS